MRSIGFGSGPRYEPARDRAPGPPPETCSEPFFAHLALDSENHFQHSAGIARGGRSQASFPPSPAGDEPCLHRLTRDRRAARRTDGAAHTAESPTRRPSGPLSSLARATKDRAGRRVACEASAAVRRAQPLFDAPKARSRRSASRGPARRRSAGRAGCRRCPGLRGRSRRPPPDRRPAWSRCRFDENATRPGPSRC